MHTKRITHGGLTIKRKSVHCRSIQTEYVHFAASRLNYGKTEELGSLADHLSELKPRCQKLLARYRVKVTKLPHKVHCNLSIQLSAISP